MTSITEVSLLCLPCGGASAAMYACWRSHLPKWIRLVPVELPGRGARVAEPFGCNIDAIIQQLCLEHTRALETPYALFGHSMGGLLAFGMADHLQRRARPLPLTLFVSASPAPASGCWQFGCRDSDEALTGDLRRFGGTPDDVFECPEFLRLALDALAADYRLCNSFHYRGPARLPVPCRVLAGRDDEIRQEHLAMWRREVTADFSIHWFDGGHFYLRPQEKSVVRFIQQQLTDRVRVLQQNAQTAFPALPAAL